MGNLRKIVGVSLAVAMMVALAVYVLIPKAGPNANSVVVNEPQAPPNGGTGSTGTTGTGGTGGAQGGGSGSAPTPSTPPTRPLKAHGENSHGPKHVVCLPVKAHPGNGVSEYQGANQYRGQCPAGEGANAYGHSHHSHHTGPNTAVVSAPVWLANARATRIVIAQ